MKPSLKSLTARVSPVMLRRMRRNPKTQILKNLQFLEKKQEQNLQTISPSQGKSRTLRFSMRISRKARDKRLQAWQRNHWKRKIHQETFWKPFEQETQEDWSKSMPGLAQAL